MKFTVTKDCILANYEEKSDKSAMYTLLMIPGYEKLVLFGKPMKDLKEMSKVQIDLDVSTKTERYMLQGQEKPIFVEVAKYFLKELRP
ncbi:hypothetical protein ACS2QB_28300 [Bacillus cereus group sp. Bce039]|uniref:hypothetical protein n=1 Tax=Bacillus cereus group sp. Bce039 TaxID=3445230 RepID=UPI003F29040A